MHLSIATTAAMGHICVFVDSNGLPHGVAHSGSKRPSFRPSSAPTDPWRLSFSLKGCICPSQQLQQWVTFVFLSIRMACPMASRTVDRKGPASDHLAHPLTLGDCH